MNTLKLTGKVIGDLKPGDVVVVSVDGPLTLEMANDIEETVMLALPEGVKCLVTPTGIAVDVLRPSTPAVSTPA